MVVLVTCKNEEDRIKNEGARVATNFPHYKPYGSYLCHGNQSSNFDLAQIVKRHFFCKFATEIRPLIDVIIWVLLKILRMNRQNLTKFCILIITGNIYVGIVMRHQFFKHRYAPEYIFAL